MKTIKQLDKLDIVSIIATAFEVDPSKVDLVFRQECRGYGSDEHYEAVLYCEVEVSE